MNRSPAAPNNRRPVGKKSVGSIAFVVLISLYAFLQPKLNDQYGWNLPGIGDSSNTVVTDNESDEDRPVITADVAGNRSKGSSPNSSETAVLKPNSAKRGPLNKGRLERESKEPSSPGSSYEKPTSSQPKAAKSSGDLTEDLKYGILREIGSQRYMSPEGLRYGPGSAEGHRLEHLRRHTQDQPGRPGKHGVFDGGMEGALQTIDNAYSRAKNNQRSTKQVDRDRTIYSVDMGKRIGYVGGRDGNRSQKPMARRVKLVLEGTNVITAYPFN